MIKRLMLIITFVLLTLPSVAQIVADTCPDTVITARDLIAQADIALTETRYADAETLLHDARQLVKKNCRAVAPTPSVNDTGNSSAQINLPGVSPTDGVAYIRVLNTLADSAAPLNVSLNGFGEIVTGLAYGEFTGLIPIPAGVQGFNELSWDFPANSTWVVAGVGLEENLSVLLEPISILRNELGGKARVRVMQAISGAERFNVTSVEGMSFGSGLGWLQFHDADVEPGSYILYADMGGNGLVIPETEFTFEANQNYTIFLIGGKDGAPAPQFVALISPQDVTRVRFTNNRAAAVDVHSRPGNNKIIEALAPGVTSDWIGIASGAVAFIAYDVGTGPSGQEKASVSEHLRSGRDLTFVIRPNGNITVEEVAFTP